MTTFERTEVQFVPGWMVIGAMQGRTAPFDEFISAPTSKPEPCRDNFAITTVERARGQIVLFAVADGISSEPNSESGSRHAVSTALEGLENECGDELPNRAALERVFRRVHRRLAGVAASLEQELSTFGTTLMVGVLDTTDGRLVSASIGDCFIVADDGQELHWFPNDLIFQPTGAVHPITDPNWSKAVKYSQFPTPVVTVIAFSDGLLHIMFEVDRRNVQKVVRSPHRKAVDAIRSAVLQADNVSRARNLSTLLGMRSDTKLMADDRTIVLLQCIHAAPGSSTVFSRKSLPISASQPARSLSTGSVVQDTESVEQSAIVPALSTRQASQEQHDARPGAAQLREDTSYKLTAILALVVAVLSIQLAEFIIPRIGSLNAWINNIDSQRTTPLQRPHPTTEQPAPHDGAVSIPPSP